MKKIFVLLFFTFFIKVVISQVLEAPPLNGVYERKNTITRKPVPYCGLREADVMWTKRVWRVIDLRQKINHPLYFPTKPIGGYKNFLDIIKDAVMLEGSITLYDATENYREDNEFDPGNRLTLEKAKQKFSGKVDTMNVEDPETGEMTQKVVTTPFQTETVKKLLLKEDWFFDKQRSVMDVRIISICLIQEIKKEGAERAYDGPIAWIYFPQARNILASRDVFNRLNTAERRSFDDIFMKRMFDSYIVQVENVYNDRPIEMYFKDGLDQLLESENIKKFIFELEHDLWEY